MAQLVYFDLGRAAYGPTLGLQERLVERVKTAPDERAYLVLVEHTPPVITLGRGSRAGHVLVPAERLAAEGIELAESSRGGDVTYHGPGQLVGYPILRLDLHGRDVHRYLRDLEEALIRCLARFGVQAARRSGFTGVWVGAAKAALRHDQGPLTPTHSHEGRGGHEALAKVAAIGVAVRRWVTYHGFALNVAPDLAAFGLIVPCGIRDRGVTSLRDLLGREVTVAEVKAPLVECLVEVFGFEGAAAGDAREYGVV
jgi:lipoate-protein ligase B